jgi:hypothetical protein
VGIDYPSVLSVTTAQATAEAANVEALAAPAAGAALAAIYFNAQMLPFSAVPLVPAGTTISSAIGVVTVAAAAAASSASSAQNTADTANIRIDNLSINLVGDVIGNSLLSSNIETLYKENSEFKGNYLKIPSELRIQETENIPDEDCIFMQKVYINY